MKERRQSEHAGVEEEEPYQTDEMTAAVAVQIRAFREERNEDVRVHLIVQHRDVSPVGRQERSSHASSASSLPVQHTKKCGQS